MQMLLKYKDIGAAQFGLLLLHLPFFFVTLFAPFFSVNFFIFVL